MSVTVLTKASEAHTGTSNTNPEDIGFWALVREDYRAHGSDFFSHGFWALFWHRFGNMRMSVQWRPLRLPLSLAYRIMFWLGQVISGIKLPYSVPVGRRVVLEHFGGMILIARSIGDDVTIRQNTTMGIPHKCKPYAWPRIGNGVEIGAQTVILGDISVGDGAVIGAGSVVTRDVAPGDVVAGVPARPLAKAPVVPVNEVSA